MEFVGFYNSRGHKWYMSFKKESLGTYRKPRKNTTWRPRVRLAASEPGWEWSMAFEGGEEARGSFQDEPQTITMKEHTYVGDPPSHIAFAIYYLGALVQSKIIKLRIYVNGSELRNPTNREWKVVDETHPYTIFSSALPPCTLDIFQPAPPPSMEEPSECMKITKVLPEALPAGYPSILTVFWEAEEVPEVVWVQFGDQLLLQKSQVVDEGHRYLHFPLPVRVPPGKVDICLIYGMRDGRRGTTNALPFTLEDPATAYTACTMNLGQDHSISQSTPLEPQDQWIQKLIDLVAVDNYYEIDTLGNRWDLLSQ